MGLYVSEDELDADELDAAIEAGEILAWRKDMHGTQWYRRIIRGVPATGAEAGAEFPTIHGTPVEDVTFSGIEDDAEIEADDDGDLDR